MFPRFRTLSLLLASCFALASPLAAAGGDPGDLNVYIGTPDLNADLGYGAKADKMGASVTTTAGIQIVYHRTTHYCEVTVDGFVTGAAPAVGYDWRLGVTAPFRDTYGGYGNYMPVAQTYQGTFWLARGATLVAVAEIENLSLPLDSVSVTETFRC